MSITLKLDEDTAVEMLVNRVGYWTDDNDVIELFEQYYENMVYNGCFDGSDFDVMSIVDNDYVNNTSVTTREEFEADRDKFIEEQLKSDGFDKEAEDFDIDEYNEALEQYEEEVTSWEELERGENTCEFMDGGYIEAITDSCLLVSW